MTDRWITCNGSEHIRPIAGELFRFVESQEQVATNALVDSLEEQDMLEALLEETKPPEVPGSEGLHYLLKTPFRYPPLPWGSRFGRTHEPSLFYGSLELITAMAETAYYRFMLYYGMESPPPSRRIRTEHTSFMAAYSTEQGIQLQSPPFSDHQDRLIHPSDYAVPQTLGTAMRESGVEAFEFVSVRCPHSGINVALFVPDALAEPKPRDLVQWLCETTANHASFKDAHGHLVTFHLEQFTISNRLPEPA